MGAPEPTSSDERARNHAFGRRRHLRSGFLFRFRRHDAVSDLDADLRSSGFRDRTLCRAVD